MTIRRTRSGCRIGEDPDRLALAAARIGLAAPVTVVDPPQLAHLVGRLAVHLSGPPTLEER